MNRTHYSTTGVPSSWLALLVSEMICALFSSELVSQSRVPYEEAPIHYSSTETSNRADLFALAIKALPNRQLPENGREALDRVLQEFSVSPDSQTLVFSKTSLQIDRIHPQNPRAIFFSDSTYIGYVPGGILELSLHDPDLGLLFYEIRPSTQTIRRRQDCLNCHGSGRTGNWPGVLIRSVFPNGEGHVQTALGSHITTHASPIEERWGGWYVTGQHGASVHLGNRIYPEDKGPRQLDLTKTSNLTTLPASLDLSAYPRADSDIVSLMVLEHQCEMHNRLSRGMLRTRKWLQYQEELDHSLGRPPSKEPTGTALTVIRGESERIVDYLLFRNEAMLPEGGIQGRPDFQTAFRSNRVVDSHGRSLKDFDLKTRLFRYPCSYMIYSPAFDSLPTQLRKAVWRRLIHQLTTEDASSKFPHLTPDVRREILSILSATKAEIHQYLPSNSGS